MLTKEELERYKRQMLMAGWGEKTQEKLKRSTVMVAGAGGLGSAVCYYLAVAGIGELRVCDSDVVEMSNLNRQILHTPSRIGMNKAISAEKTLQETNPQVKIVPFPETLTADNVDHLIGKADVLLDCLDNFSTRYLLNDASLRLGIPLVFGAVRGLEGRLSVLAPPETPCLRCVFPEEPLPEVFPVVGATPGVIGCLQAVEALKVLTGIGTPLKNKLLLWDGMTMSFSQFQTRKSPNCPSCGSK
ncbi:MAG: HesA/MoeB/ThiF family protein [Candidatus Omnitrophota bacterium]